MASPQWKNFQPSLQDSAIHAYQRSSFSQTSGNSNNLNNLNKNASTPSGTSNGLREAGIVEKLLHSYGFIQCCERQARLFFHYSQFSGNIEHLKLGDPVEFEMTYDKRTGKPIASAVIKISTEALSDEVLSSERVSGFVTTEINDDAEGRVAYESRGECFFLPYTKDDLEGIDVHLTPGDKVTFQIATDKCTGNLRARNIRLEIAQPKRHQGVICALKETFGFIERADVVKEIFFHSSECKDFKDLNPGDDVEFTIQTRNNKEVATNIIQLPTGTVIFDDISNETVLGQVITFDKLQTKRSEPISGKIRCRQDNREMEISFGERDIKGDGTVQVGDLVQFNIATDRRDQLQHATNIELLDKSFLNSAEMRDEVEFTLMPLKLTNQALSNDTKAIPRNTMMNGYKCTYHGFVAALKDGFGFIETEDHDREIFFHFSVYDGNINSLEIGQEVEYSISCKGSKLSAENVHKLPMGTIPSEDIMPEIMNGIVIRPVRCFNPEQEEYSGLIQLTADENMEVGIEYPFGITSLADKHEFLQKGDVVQFQLGIAKNTRQQRAVNIKAIRTYFQATVETIKGNFGFLSHEVEEGKKLFFHMSEVRGGVNLQSGDRVEFVIVHHQRTGKYSACRVVKIGESQPSQRPERLISRLRSVSLNGSNPRVVVIRQPKGPDGTNGFKTLRRNTHDTMLLEDMQVGGAIVENTST